MHRKKTRKKIPLQGNFFPMTSMMSIENNVDRVTIVSSETHGVASLSPGIYLSCDIKVKEKGIWEQLNIRQKYFIMQIPNEENKILV